MQRRACALLPLGAHRGPDALNVWEHIAFGTWLEQHALLGDEARAALADERYEAEAALYEAAGEEEPSSDFSDIEDDGESGDDECG